MSLWRVKDLRIYVKKKREHFFIAIVNTVMTYFNYVDLAEMPSARSDGCKGLSPLSKIPQHPTGGARVVSEIVQMTKLVAVVIQLKFFV